MSTKLIKDIKVGDIIFPPEREMRLWMKRELAEKGLSESAQALSVVSVDQARPDKKGEWVIIKARYSREWTRDYAEPEKDHFMSFKARPQTPWLIMG